MCRKTLWPVVGLVPLLASCVSEPVALAPVGPHPTTWKAVVPATGKGQLQVFTETDEYEWDHDVPYFPHRDYQVFTADGKHLQRVWNSQSHEDETPTVVDLTAGN